MSQPQILKKTIFIFETMCKDLFHIGFEINKIRKTHQNVNLFIYVDRGYCITKLENVIRFFLTFYNSVEFYTPKCLYNIGVFRRLNPKTYDPDKDTTTFHLSLFLRNKSNINDKVWFLMIKHFIMDKRILAYVESEEVLSVNKC